MTKRSFLSSFYAMPLKKKLLASFMSTVLLLLLLSCSVFMIYDYLSEQQDRLEEASAIADIIAKASTAALTYNDAEDARKLLSALNAHPEILVATLNRNDATILARYTRSGKNVPQPEAIPENITIKHDTIYLTRPVISNNQRIGSFSLQFDISSLTNRMLRFFEIALVVTLIIVSATYLVITAIMKYITIPLQELSETAHAVTVLNNYSIRAEHFYPDEIGKLAISFNIMLTHIQERDQQLADYHNQLEGQVKERTCELEATNNRLQHEIDVRRLAEQARILAEDELLKSRKLESIGILAGGIAHDFNNILTSVVGFISLARNNTKNADKQREYLKTAERGCFRAKNLTRQLLSFSKGGTPHRRATALLPVVSESIDISMVGSNVLCNLEAPELLPLVKIDSGQIIQVLNNLLINACQAMPDGGTIDIKIAHVIAPADSSQPLAAGEYLKISLTDCGKGIAEEDLHKVFDPYFSTKPMGSGLGLATCYAIIKSHEGLITVTSTPDHGSTFTVFLPTCPDASTAEPPAQAQQSQENGQIKRHVLVMDDEPDIRDVATAMLELLDCSVTTAQDGNEALAQYRKAFEAGTPFDVTILDVTIPGGMGGLETIKKLHELDKDARVIVSSGYAEEPVMADYQTYGFVGAIAKPYTLEDVKEVLQHALTAANPGTTPP
jgi:signal transduction histidine kinase/CheY-like chemotaxis protein